MKSFERTEGIREELNIQEEARGAYGAWRYRVRRDGPAFLKGEVNEKKYRMLRYSPCEFEHYEDFISPLHPDDYERAMKTIIDHLKVEEEVRG